MFLMRYLSIVFSLADGTSDSGVSVSSYIFHVWNCWKLCLKQQHHLLNNLTEHITHQYLAS